MKLKDIELVDYKIVPKVFHSSITSGSNSFKRYFYMLMNARALMEQYPNINHVRFSGNGKMSISFYR